MLSFRKTNELILRKLTDRRKDGQMNRRTDRKTDGRMDGPMDGRTDGQTLFYRTLPVEARGPKYYLKNEIVERKYQSNYHEK